MSDMMVAPPSSNWRELDSNLLADIFGRLDLSDRLLSIPLVCKPWNKASLLPTCWRILNFRMPSRTLSRLEDAYLDFSFSGLLKLLLVKSQGSVTHLFCYSSFTIEDLELLSNECPKLKLVVFPWINWNLENQICQLIGKWKELEVCSMRENSTNMVVELLKQIAENCKRFKCLQLVDVCMNAEMVSAVVEHVPDIRELYLWNLRMDREALLGILRGCKHLVRLSVKKCTGFDGDDEEILEFGKSIRYFSCEDCQLRDEKEYYDEGLGMRDVYDGNSDDGYEP